MVKLIFFIFKNIRFFGVLLCLNHNLIHIFNGKVTKKPTVKQPSGLLKHFTRNIITLNSSLNCKIVKGSMGLPHDHCSH